MVQPKDLGHIIDEHPFFQGIDGKLRALLVGCAANERFDAGEYLLREGGEARKFFLIRAGTVAVQVEAPVRKAVVLETLSDGDILGWSWMVPPHRATFAARAQTPVRVLSFDSCCLLKKMEDEPALGYEVLRRFVPIMAHRLSAARLQMLDLYGPAVAPPPKATRLKVESAQPETKGRNRSATARLEGEAAKAALKIAKRGKDKPAISGGKGGAS